MSKHTPGPWTIAEVVDRSIIHLCPIDKDDQSLLTIVYQDETPFAAVYKKEDAILIAAAPELLEILQRIADGKVMNPDMEFSHLDTVLAYQDLARAAIAKATGAV